MLKSLSAVSLLLFAVAGPRPESSGQPAAPLQARFWLESHPGQEVVLNIGPLRAGRYEFYDDFNPKSRGHIVAK